MGELAESQDLLRENSMTVSETSAYLAEAPARMVV